MKGITSVESKGNEYQGCLFRVPEDCGRAIWQITNRCNYSCRYCMFGSGRKASPDELSTEAVKDVLLQLLEANFQYIKFTGGEPFMRSDMLDILAYASSLNLKVDISTNASLISRKRAERLGRLDLDMVHVSLDGHCKNIHEAARGSATFDRTVRGLRALVSAGIYVRIGAVVFRDNEKFLDQLVHFSHSLGASEIVFSLMEPAGRLQEKDALLTRRSPADLASEVTFLKGKYAGKIVVGGNFSGAGQQCCSVCPALKRFLFIDNLGRVSPCTWIAERAPKFRSKVTLKDHSLDQVLDSNPLKLYLRLISSESGMNKRTALNSAAKFAEQSKIYSFTTENIAGYLPYLDVSGKSVLTICGSGDHVLNSVLLGASRVTAFDINKRANYWTELKMAAVKQLSLEEFGIFTLRFKGDQAPNPKVLDYMAFKEISERLSSEALRFFEGLYKKYNYSGYAIRNSKCFNNRYDYNETKINSNLYLQSREQYRSLKNNLKSSKVEFFNSNLLELGSLSIKRGYDIVLLSNVSDYAQQLFPERMDYLAGFAEQAVFPLTNLLSSNGLICAAYVYNFSAADVDGPAYRSQIDYPEKRRKAFEKRDLSYEEVSFPSVIPDKKDLVVLLTSKGEKE